MSRAIILICEYTPEEVKLLKSRQVSASMLDPDITGVIVKEDNTPMVFSFDSDASDWIRQYKLTFAFPKSVCLAPANFDVSKLEKVKM